MKRQIIAKELENLNNQMRIWNHVKMCAPLAPFKASRRTVTPLLIKDFVILDPIIWYVLKYLMSTKLQRTNPGYMLVDKGDLLR